MTGPDEGSEADTAARITPELIDHEESRGEGRPRPFAEVVLNVCNPPQVVSFKELGGEWSPRPKRWRTAERMGWG